METKDVLDDLRAQVASYKTALEQIVYHPGFKTLSMLEAGEVFCTMCHQVIEHSPDAVKSIWGYGHVTSCPVNIAQKALEKHA